MRKKNNENVKTSFILVVDHPVRDLFGIIRVACELLRQQYTIYLIPWNLISLTNGNILKLIPSKNLLLNYYRKNNEYLVNSLLKRGFKLHILETEGGLLNLNDYLKYVGKPTEGNNNLSMLTWNKKSTIGLNSLKEFNGIKIMQTGSPRYDLYDSKIQQNIKEDFQLKEKYGDLDIVFSTTFSFVNSKYNNNKYEKYINENDLNFNSKAVINTFNKEKIDFDNFIQVIKVVAEHFDTKNILIRPHPFENSHTYKVIFSKFNNVLIDNRDNFALTAPFIKVLVHSGCSTAFEFQSTSGVTFLPGWLSSSNNEDFRLLNDLVANENDLLMKIDYLLRNGIFKNKSNSFVDIFGDIDGQSAKRIFNVLINNYIDYRPNFFSTLFKFFTFLDFYFKYVLNSLYIHIVGNENKIKNRAKFFTSQEVIDNINLNCKIDSSFITLTDYKVETIFKHKKYGSILKILPI